MLVVIHPGARQSGKTVARITIYRSWALFNRRVWGKDYSYGLTRGVTAYEEDKKPNKRSSGNWSNRDKLLQTANSPL